MKVGFVTIVGRPNVGKSTLLNAIMNYRVAITSEKPQTTRDQIRGIFNDDDSQIVFIDTPGIHKPKQKLGAILNNSSYKALENIDLVLFLQPIDNKIGPGDKYIIKKIKNQKRIAIISKIDKATPENIVNRVKELKQEGFNDILTTSVKIPNSISSLVNYLKNNLNDGTPFYDRDQVTDKSMRFIAKEIIRESIVNLTRDEIPHSIGVEIESFDEEENIIKIAAVIYVERNSQKGIIIGNRGLMIKQIGISSRKKIGYNFNSPIRLDLIVKVSKNWTSKLNLITKMGY